MFGDLNSELENNGLFFEQIVNRTRIELLSDAEIFKNLTMDIIWDVFFYIQELQLQGQSYLRISLAAQEQIIKMNLLSKALTWNSLKQGYSYIKWLRQQYLAAKKKLKNYRYMISLNH